MGSGTDRMIRDPRPSFEDIRTVLLVEDDILVRVMVAEELREAGLRVVEAGNADEALEHLVTGIPVDFVFTDIELPGSMNGIALTRLLQASFPDCKFLMTSGRLPSHETISLRPFIPKPYDIAGVVEHIRAALAEPPPE
jgi:CheY-like chemotaxis protein